MVYFDLHSSAAVELCTALLCCGLQCSVVACTAVWWLALLCCGLHCCVVACSAVWWLAVLILSGLEIKSVAKLLHRHVITSSPHRRAAVRCSANTCSTVGVGGLTSACRYVLYCSGGRRHEHMLIRALLFWWTAPRAHVDTCSTVWVGGATSAC